MAQAEAPSPAPRSRLAWLQQHALPPVRPIEFSPNGTTLSPDAQASLALVAKALLAQPSLKLHIAGHIAADEDPRLSSQRAQAVGAALIAAGAAPSRLRAKGYGATVPLSATQRSKMRLRSERRAGLHAIGTIATAEPIEFAARCSDVESGSRRVLLDVAALLKENPKVRLSVEGHSDEMEAAQDDKGPSASGTHASHRAEKVCAVLHKASIAPARLVPHGFGALLPAASNNSDDGRQQNRRVELLVIPDVSA